MTHRDHTGGGKTVPWMTMALLASGSWLLMAAPAAQADVYYYQDADGVFHFTNVATPKTQPFIVDKPLTDELIPDSPRALSSHRTLADNDAYDDIIQEYASHYDVEPALVKAVIRAESSFNRLAVSPKGARGLMQLMPTTARIYGVRNILDARENIRAGTRHLRRLMDKYRTLTHALAAYNAGSAPVERYRGVPPFPETRTYISRVMRFRQEYLQQARLASVSARES